MSKHSLSKKKETKKQAEHSMAQLKLEVVEQMIALATAGLGLVAALAWNEAIQDLFSLIFPEQESLIAKFIYAILITVLIVFAISRLGKISNKLKREVHGEKRS